MPSDQHRGRSRSAIVKWRVLDGRQEVFQYERKKSCEEWIRKNRPVNGGSLRLVAPNV